jgi:alkaline phosphatase D
MLGTRVTPAVESSRAIEVSWRVARDAALRDVVAKGSAATDGARDYTVHVDAAGLDPGETYFYAFKVGGVLSPVGRTRTLPVGDVARLRLASCSCSNYPHGYFNAYAAIARRTDLDFVLHLGDYIYEYGPEGFGGGIESRYVEPRHETVSLADYRTRYAWYRRDPDLQALHGAHAVIPVWDDHESANDAWWGGAQNHDAATEGPWPARRAAAIQAWREWMPARVPAPDADGTVRAWRSFSIGGLADLYMLDTRIAGRDVQADRADANAIARTDRMLLGAEQERWLFERIDESRGAWRILGQQIVFAPWARPPRLPNADAWDGYPAARARVLDRIESSGTRDWVVMTGDVHSSWALEVPRNAFDRGAANSLAIELVAPAISSFPLAKFPNARERFAASLEELPHLRWFDIEQRGYVVLDLSTERAQAEWWFMDTVTEPSTAEHLAARFVTPRGTSRLERVA